MAERCERCERERLARANAIDTGDALLELDVVLLGEEQPHDVAHLLADRFGVDAHVNPVQYNSATTLLIMGSHDQLRRVKHWYAAKRTPRPDLQGVPPVGKGERRT